MLANNQSFTSYQNDTNLQLTNLFQENTLRYNFSKKIDLTANLNFQNTIFNNDSISKNIFFVTIVLNSIVNFLAKK